MHLLLCRARQQCVTATLEGLPPPGGGQLLGQIGEERGQRGFRQAGQGSRQRLHRGGPSAERLDLDPDRGQVRGPFGDPRGGGRGQAEQERNQERLDLTAPLGRRATQALVVHALVGGVLVDQHQAARPLADEIRAVKLAQVA